MIGPLDQIRITDHAVDALQEFYPRATRGTVLTEVAAGVVVDPDIAKTMLGRKPPRRKDTTFVLHRERTGLFAVCNATVVTFLRFYSLDQHRFACQHWPGGEPVTARSLWRAVAQPRTVVPAELDAQEARRQAADIAAAAHLRTRGWVCISPDETRYPTEEEE